MEELKPEEHIKIDLSQKIFDLMENAIIKESTARMLAEMAVDYIMTHTMSKHLDILGHPAKAQTVDVNKALVDVLNSIIEDSASWNDYGKDETIPVDVIVASIRDIFEQALESVKRSEG